MINRNINNVDELKAEIARLKLLQREQEGYLNDQFGLFQEKIESPIHFFNKLTSWIPKGKKSDINPTFGNSETDWVTNSFRVALPFVFNKVLFRKAGFIKKGLLLLASQKAAGAINQDRLIGIIDKVSSLIRPSKKRNSKRERRDYGIPPDSETY